MSYRDIAREQLKQDEGVREKVYMDSVGIPTIGVGRNLKDVGLSPYEINVLLENGLYKGRFWLPNRQAYVDAVNDVFRTAASDKSYRFGGSYRKQQHVYRSAWRLAHGDEDQ